MLNKQSDFEQHYFFRVTMIIVFLCLFISDFSIAYESQINTLSSAMAEKIAKAGKKTIAVVDFTDLEGNVTQLGRFIAEELSGALAGTGKEFEVVNRNNLKLILKEHKLFETGVIDPKSAMKLGEIAGVQALVTGTITPFTENIRLSVSVLDINTAKMIDNKREKIPRTNDIDELLGKEIEPETTRSQKEKATPIPTNKDTGPWIVKMKGFTFELLACKRQGGSVKCEFFVTSDTDKQIRLKRYSTLIDNFNNKYKASNVKLANCSRRSYCKMELINAIRVDASLTFEGVTSNATHAAVLDIDCFSSSSFTPRFRNIPIK